MWPSLCGGPVLKLCAFPVVCEDARFHLSGSRGPTPKEELLPCRLVALPGRRGYADDYDRPR